MSRLVLLLAMLTSAAAGADPAPKHLSFEDDNVEGDIPRPDEGLVAATVRPARERLIRVRLHFIPELVRSAESQ